jgi:hypothetical protein
MLTVTQKRYIKYFSDVIAFRGLVPNMEALELGSLALYSTAPTPDELRGYVKPYYSDQALATPLIASHRKLFDVITITSFHAQASGASRGPCARA